MRIVSYKFGECNAGIIGYFTSIIKELLGTKMNECNKICQTLMNMKVTI